jgi:hypothetical protein
MCNFAPSDEVHSDLTGHADGAHVHAIGSRLPTSVRRPLDRDGQRSHRGRRLGRVGLHLAARIAIQGFSQGKTTQS